MTLTGHTDGDDAASGVSYLEIARVLVDHGARTDADLRELWSRIVFNLLVSNTDDHLRNHGFLLTPQGLTLSPVYDINPTPDGKELSLAINEVDTHCEIAIAMEAHRDYGLSKAEADAALRAVRDAAGGWRQEAGRLDIPHAQQRLMAEAFTLDS